MAHNQPLLESAELLQQRHRTSSTKLLKPSLWHITLLELGKFSSSCSRDTLDAIEAGCKSVVRSVIPVMHEDLVTFRASHACVLTCSADTNQLVAQLRQALVATIRGRSIKCKPASTPHMTLFYDQEHHLSATPLDPPLTWNAAGFSLLCSHKGLGHLEVVRHWAAEP